MLLAITTDQVATGSRFLQTVLVLGGLAFAGRQLRESVTSREEQGRPYVAAYFDLRPGLESFPDIVVKNLGATAAYDIRFEVSPPLRSSADDDGYPIAEANFLRSGIPTLAPSMEVRAWFDTMIGRPKEWELAYSVTITYRDRSGHRLEDHYSLDLSPHMGTLHTTRHNIHDVHEQLKKLVTEVERLRKGWGGAMPVVVEEREAHRARTEREMAERRRELEAVRSQTEADDT